MEIDSFGDFTKRYYLPARPYGFAFFRLYFRLKVTGLEHLPQTGPGIIVANHTSFLDPPLLAAVVPRVLYFIMLHEHYYHPKAHWLFSRLPCIPVKRNNLMNFAALKQCLHILHHGQLLCVFPEGGISEDIKSGGAKQGATLLALRAQVPIIPVGINGAADALALHQRFPRPKPIRINCGSPIPVPPIAPQEKERLQEFTDNTMLQVESLLTGVT